MTEPPRELYDAYRAPEPSPDLAQRIAAAVQADHRGRRRRRTLVWAAAASLVLVLGAALLLWRGMPAGRGEVSVTEGPHTLALGPRVRAVAQAGAHLSWRVAAEGVSVSHRRGAVRYRVERGTPLEVQVPGGYARVLGTEFDVEVIPMRRTVRRGAVAAAVLATVAVTVYQGRVLLGNDRGSVTLAHDQRGEIAPGQEPRRRAMAQKTGAALSSAPTAGQARSRRLASREARQALIDLLHRTRQAREQTLRTQSPVSPGAPGGGGTESPAAKGSLPAEYIRSTIKEATPLVKECYELALHENPDVQGTLKLRFTIAAEPEVGGVVELVEVQGQDAAALHPTLRECLEQTIYSLQFPPPEGGGKVQVTYPFRFATGRRAPR